MSLFTFRNLILSHGSDPLIENANFTIKKGEKVCLIGRNGMGKSSLLRFINGELEIDSGTMELHQSPKIAMLPQEVPAALTGTVAEIVAHGIAAEAHTDWQWQHQIDATISKLDLNGEAAFSSLSGGLKRRVLLAQALAQQPEILLLDEPTNHLDIEAINWLEKFLLNFKQTLIFVTHDRMLMQKIANHIIEIDNGNLISWRGSYNAYLQHKEAAAAAKEKAEALFDKKLAQEEAWIRQGIKARRTRNEGRVRHLKKLREQRANRRTKVGKVKLQQQDFELSGDIVFKVRNINYHYSNGNVDIIKDFSTTIMRSDKIGIIGSNGSGKSTLINLLTGKLEPTAGTVKHGTNLKIAYFDQYRYALDDTKTVAENVAPGGETITIGNKSKHVISYLQDFLFSPQRARSSIKMLSGGERNRVMLAKILAEPCNVLILDEPTNDLDVETLELLEEQLLDFAGTLILVSHDRVFLNNIVTSTLVMEGDGKVGEYVGGYDDWLRQRPQLSEPSKVDSVDTESKKSQKAKTAVVRKLNFNEQRELRSLPAKIEKLEQQQQQLQQQLSDPEFYQQHLDKIADINKTLQQLEQELEAAYNRWQQLED